MVLKQAPLKMSGARLVSCSTLLASSHHAETISGDDTGHTGVRMKYNPWGIGRRIDICLHSDLMCPYRLVSFKICSYSGSYGLLYQKMVGLSEIGVVLEVYG